MLKLIALSIAGCMALAIQAPAQITNEYPLAGAIANSLSPLLHRSAPSAIRSGAAYSSPGYARSRAWANTSR